MKKSNKKRIRLTKITVRKLQDRESTLGVILGKDSASVQEAGCCPITGVNPSGPAYTCGCEIPGIDEFVNPPPDRVIRAARRPVRKRR